MPVIDMHTHWVPRPYRDAIAAGADHWLGVDRKLGEYDLVGMRLTIEQRIADMDAMGVDLQVLSPQVGMYQYGQAAADGLALSQACNDDLAQVVAEHPARFAAIGTLPMQDVDAAIGELDRIMTVHGFSGAELGHHVSGVTYDDPAFLPFWQHVSDTGATIFFHQGYEDTHFSIGKYHLDNSIGNLAEHAMNFGVLVGGGVLDRFPDLKLVFAHAGGYIAFGASRMDKAAGHFSRDRESDYRPAFLAKPRYQGVNAKAPSEYIRAIHYDSCTYSEATLRFLIDQVGADRVMFGSDCPAPMLLTDGARWIADSTVLTEEEKEAILYENAARIFGLK